MPKPGKDFTTPTVGSDKFETMLTPEPIRNEEHPNMPVLNPKTNFRYHPEQSSLNGIEAMKPM